MSLCEKRLTNLTKEDMKTLGIIIALIVTGIVCWIVLCEMRSRHLKKMIKLGHTGMRCKYWCGEVSNYSTIEHYYGNGSVRIKDEIMPIHIDNIEPPLI